MIVCDGDKRDNMKGRLFSRRAVLCASVAGFALPGRGRAQEETDVPGVSALLDGSGLVRIPQGEFEMGSHNGNADEQPAHRVHISRAFEIGRYEVTQEQWDVVMRDPHARSGTPVNPSQFRGRGQPVEYVSWEDVQVFLHRMNARDDRHIYRLPSEAEWEYACRADAAEEPSGNPDNAWFERNAAGKTHPVGEKAPNAWGLYDTLGNVAEWVNDWFDREYYRESPAADPPGPDTGSYRVYRGGCWFDPASTCRASYRGFDFPSSQFYNVGFRLVRTLKG
jgi:formylglycine-generating enzyme required for sulfatase activity